MESMTVEHLAAVIIVASFCGVMGGFIGHEIGRFIWWAFSKVKGARERRGKDKSNGDEVEQ